MLVKPFVSGLSLFASIVLSAPTLQGTTHLNTFEKRDLASTLATRLSPGASIIFPQDTNWQQVTERWTKYQAPSFRVAIEPATEKDVVEIVIQSLEEQIIGEKC